ncbi:hypothetical protein ACIG3E_33680 [Streptomyces sp. NPDC053474]|uniref:hypothetical protein n=1 Tax=Streptomyces sp. NPDC053474 TaxID=3365704 RepID=UPI0037D204D8
MIFLPEPGYGPGGPDGRGWNRLSLNAHFDSRPQCGLLPQNYAALFESMTGRQAWGGFDRCLSTPRGGCGDCRVQQLHLKHDGVVWPEGTPLLLARTRPLPAAADSTFATAAAGLSALELFSWLGERQDVAADWRTVRNTPGLQLGRRFQDRQGEAFWLVRSNPRAASAIVHSHRYGAHTRHALYAGEGEPRLAVLQCHNRCTHPADSLRQFTADLAGCAVGYAPEPAPALPARLPGAPGVEFGHAGAAVTIHRHGEEAHLFLDIALDTERVTALAAYAVRLTAA